MKYRIAQIFQQEVEKDTAHLRSKIAEYYANGLDIIGDEEFDNEDAACEYFEKHYKGDFSPNRAWVKKYPRPQHKYDVYFFAVVGITETQEEYDELYEEQFECGDTLILDNDKKNKVYTFLVEDNIYRNYELDEIYKWQDYKLLSEYVPETESCVIAYNTDGGCFDFDDAYKGEEYIPDNHHLYNLERPCYWTVGENKQSLVDAISRLYGKSLTPQSEIAVLEGYCVDEIGGDEKDIVICYVDKF